MSASRRGAPRAHGAIAAPQLAPRPCSRRAAPAAAARSSRPLPPPAAWYSRAAAGAAEGAPARQQHTPPARACAEPRHPRPSRPRSYRGWLDANWRREVGSRMPRGSHYLDFTGSGLYTNAQLAAAYKELGSVVLGNPHSTNPSSALSTEELRRARARVLAWLNADPEEYAVAFVRCGAVAPAALWQWWGPGAPSLYRRSGAECGSATPPSCRAAPQFPAQSHCSRGAPAGRRGSGTGCVASPVPSSRRRRRLRNGPTPRAGVPLKPSSWWASSTPGPRPPAGRPSAGRARGA